jgi:hypothetical protein
MVGCRVNARHAAALALLGWYLMIPPRDEKGVLQPHSPLRKWRQKLLEHHEDSLEERIDLPRRRKTLPGSPAQLISAPRLEIPIAERARSPAMILPRSASAPIVARLPRRSARSTFTRGRPTSSSG